MNFEFMQSLLMISIMFFILSSGFKFFLNLKWELDFSYLAMILFWSYSWVLLNNFFNFWIIISIFLAFLLSILFTFFILFLSNKLSEMYFTMWTLALYMIWMNLASNLEMTWWAMWLSVINNSVFWDLFLSGNLMFLFFVWMICMFVMILLLYIKTSFFYKWLVWWWEKEIVLKSLWLKVEIYKFFMMMITTFLATLWWNLYSFYFMFIDPGSFWMHMLMPILIISLMSYSFKEIWTLMMSILVMFIYEYMSFLKMVEATKLWFFSEMIFSVLIMMVAFMVFKKTDFGSEM